MRLTLRTLLAYLDERLEPTDAADIGHRIEESPVAMQVVNRIRDVTRRLRLGAPRLSGKQLGLDPNLVAEYLDNTLPAERIPEFEKVCLGPGQEADAHLAEVASCHQVLALVLSSPATVDPACRQRMYRLASAEAAPEAPQTLVRADAAEPRTLVVPEYLRPAPSRWPWIAVPIAAVALGLLAFAVSKSLSPRSNGTLAQAPATRDARPEGAPEAGAPAVAELAAEPTSAKPESTHSDSSGVPPVGSESAEPVPDGSTSEAAPGAAREAAAPEATAGSEPTVAETAAPPAPEAAPSETDVTSIEPPTPASTIGTDLTSNPTPLPPSPTPAAPTPAAAEGAADESVGRLVSEESELIARWDEAERAWVRLPGKEPLKVGDRLLCFPSFRPKFTFSSGLTVELIGASRVELAPPDAAGVPGLRVDFGRITAMTAGKTGVKLRLLTGEDEAVVTFKTADSALGYEVRPTHVEGLDPAVEPPHAVAWIYASQGTVDWSEGGESSELAAPHVDQVDGHRLISLDEALPPWVFGQERTSTLDANARKIFATRMALERPVDLGLKELAVDRRTEARSLAMRCLALLDDFDGLLDALGEVKMRSGWNNYIESLRFAMAAQPEAAQRVQETLQRERSDDAERLYRLLWGFSREQLAQGEAQALIADLESESLDVRVLANWNVARITGKSFYTPEQTPKQRQSAVQRLRRMVEEGEFIPTGDLPGEAPAKSETSEPLVP